MIYCAFLAACWLLATSTSGAPTADLVKSLPNIGSLPFPMYSGYLNLATNKNKFIHYVFVPATDRKVQKTCVWFNGGPGCSSLDGFFYENGPYKFSPNDDRKNLSMSLNPYAWSRVCNMMWIEAPVGVGFSYSLNTSDYSINDNQTADDNHAALKQWRKEFPEHNNDDLWIFGESYGGIYVPTLFYRLAMDSEFDSTLRGWGAGNPLTDHRYDTLFEAVLPQLVGRGIISPSLNAELWKYCKGAVIDQTRCSIAKAKMDHNLEDIDPYNLDGLCWSQRKPKQVVGCIDSEKANLLLNNDETKQALHVKSSIAWQICSDKLNYHDITPSTAPIYIEMHATKKYRILVYSGDADSVVSYHGSIGWINAWGVALRAGDDEHWRPWKYADNAEGQAQVGGYASYYEGGFTFTTVRGASHMVPQSKPRAAMQMFTSFIDNSKYLG